MFRALFCILALTYSCVGWTQAEPPQDLIPRGQALIEAWDNLENQNSRVYHKYLLVLEYIGPIQYQQMQTIDIERMRNQMTMDLTEESRARVHEFIRSYDPRNFEGPDQEIARRVRGIGSQMLVFLNSMDGNTGYELVQRYESEGYSVRRSLKTRMYHLGPEIMRFAAAIVVVRIATCFGGSPQKVLENITQWRTPEMIASNTDPVCVDEIMDMLKSPIFYVGFTAFIAGSSVANSLTMQALRNLDPDRGPRTRAFEKNWLPNIALAVGFMADHLVKTLIQNEYLLTCGKDAVAGMAVSTWDAGHSVIARETLDDETFEVRDFFAGFRDSTCRRALASIKSHQFLYEELGVGLTGLVATAVTMAKGGQALGWINAQIRATDRIRNGANILSRAARGTKLAAHLSRYSVVLSLAGGPIGFAVGMGRMVVFLGLFEVINPYIEQIYFEGLVKADVDRKTRAFQQAAGQLSPQNFPLNPYESCSEHYTGEQENGNLQVCSRLPLIASLYSFHDFSRIWREKHILKDFLEAHARWKQKVTSFINNYLMSFEMLKTLTRTREMYLNFKQYLHDQGGNIEQISFEDYISEVDRLERSQLEDRLQSILQEIPDESERQNFYDEVRSEFERHNTSDYESSFAKEPLSNPGRQIHDIMDELSYHEFLLQILPFGTPFKGINGMGHFPEAEELDQLAMDIVEFIGDPDSDNFSYVEIRDHRDTLHNVFPARDTADLLGQIGMPLNFAYHTKQIDMIRYYLSVPDREFNVLGLLLFQEWAPFMRGPYNPMYGAIDENGENRFNPRGLHPEQWPLYNSVVEALEYFTPTMPWEMWYILGTYGELPSREKTDIDGQFDETSHNLQTKILADFVLTQLMCGQNASFRNLFGDNGGVALQYNFPTIMEGDICHDIVHEIHMDGEDAPSPFRSVFATENGLYLGLHQAYIRHPEDTSNPLMFSKEQDAGSWWNREIHPQTFERLGAMRLQFEDSVEEHFNSRLSDVEIDNGNWWTATKSFFSLFFGGQTNQQRQVQRATSTESLTLSFANEFYHYRSALQHILGAEEYGQLEPHLIDTAGCIVQMINAIPEKKYRVVRQGCESSIDSVKFALDTRNGRYNSEESQADLQMVSEEDLDQDQRRDRVVREVWSKINKLLGEIERYQQMIHESFNFDLEQGETL